MSLSQFLYVNTILTILFANLDGLCHLPSMESPGRLVTLTPPPSEDYSGRNLNVLAFGAGETQKLMISRDGVAVPRLLTRISFTSNWDSTTTTILPPQSRKVSHASSILY